MAPLVVGRWRSVWWRLGPRSLAVRTARTWAMWSSSVGLPCGSAAARRCWAGATASAIIPRGLRTGRWESGGECAIVVASPAASEIVDREAEAVSGELPVGVASSLPALACKGVGRLRDGGRPTLLLAVGSGGGLFSTPGCPGSIVGAAAFHFRVRDENGWCHRALTTRGPSFRPRQVGRKGGGARGWWLSGCVRCGHAVDARRAEQVLRPLADLVAGEGFEPPTFGL